MVYRNVIFRLCMCSYNAAVKREPEEVRYGVFVAKFHERHVVEAEVVRARQDVWIGIHLNE